MPIPIPVPMPVGPHAGTKFPPPPPHHHFHQHQQNNDEEGEVKKIYLLQPIPKAKPQPQLKGGGFMGPAMQTHIHLPGPVVRQKFHQPPRHQQHASRPTQSSYDGDNGQLDNFDRYAPPSAGKSGAGNSELKILPIVVIPPVAPMPPIQVPQSAHMQTPRMSLTPQFNNYVVAGSESERKKMQQNGNHYTNEHSSFSDYGGSIGGSVFRDNYARSRHRGRNPRHQSSLTSNPDTGSRSRSRDFDYGGDSDYEGTIPSSSRNEFYHQASARSGNRRHSRSNNGPRRPTHRGSHNYGRDGPPGRFNSIQDIIDQAQFDDEPSMGPELGAGGEQTYAYDDARLSRQQNHQGFALDNSISNSDALKITDGEHPSKGKPMRLEISLDDVSAQVDRELQLSRNNKQQDLSSLYYDRDLQQAEFSRSSRANRLADQNPGTRPSRPRGRILYPDEQNILDDDEWRFDSIKSVIHVGANDTMTDAKTNNDHNSTISNNSTLPTSQPADNGTRPPKY